MPHASMEQVSQFFAMPSPIAAQGGQARISIVAQFGVAHSRNCPIVARAWTALRLQRSAQTVTASSTTNSALLIRTP
ncbi:hypothetical protein BST61_g148 [Cercospora zeina]